MTSIRLIVRGAEANAEVQGILTSGMVGIPVTIEYDGAWEGLTKNLVCRGGLGYENFKGISKTILGVETAAKVAPEVMIAGEVLYLGIEGYNEDGTKVIPTIWACCGAILEGAKTGDSVSEDPTLPIWAQLQAHIDQIPEIVRTAVEEAMQDGGVGGGNGIHSAQLNDDYTLTLTFDDGTSYTTPSIRGATGGDGKDGKDGTSATHSWNGTVLTINSASGSSSADLKGQPGKDGVDGYTPQKDVDYFDGKDGTDGKDGSDGVSPTVTISKSGKVTTVSITDKNGTKTATINDGADGKTPVKGADYVDGKDGTSVTVKSVNESTADGGSNVVTFSDGKTVIIKNGSKGGDGSPGTSVNVSYVSESTASGGTNVVTFSDGKKINIKNGINGTDGKDGKTPVKGTDYWTTEDQAAIVQQILDTMGMSVFGRVDANNNIYLTGALDDGTYTLKYEDAQGNVTDICTYVHNNTSESDEPTPTYSNVLPRATTNDGKTVYNGTGYKVGARIGSSGTEGTVSNTSATNPIFLTGYIKVPEGATIRMKNCFIDTNGVNGTINNAADKNYYGHDLAGLYGIMVYTNLSAPTFDSTVTNYYWNTFANCSVLASKPTVDGNGYVTEFTLNTTTEKYIRMHLGGDSANAIITVNEPITD